MINHFVNSFFNNKKNFTNILIFLFLFVDIQKNSKKYTERNDKKCTGKQCALGWIKHNFFLELRVAWSLKKKV
jgi:hypothetical protein